MSSRSPYLRSLACLLCLCLIGTTLAGLSPMRCAKDSQRCYRCHPDDPSICEYCQYNVMEIQATKDKFREYYHYRRVCTDKPNTIKNCLSEKLDDGKHICEECDAGYYKKDNKCLKGTTKHCVLYKKFAKDMTCDLCKNNRIYVPKTGKCERLPKDKIIPNCEAHKLMRYRMPKFTWYKPYCRICKAGYTGTYSRGCVKTCMPGCTACSEDTKPTKCLACDNRRMFFLKGDGKCKYFPLPKGHYNIFLDPKEIANRDDKPGTWASFSKLLKLGFD